MKLPLILDTLVNKLFLLLIFNLSFKLMVNPSFPIYIYSLYNILKTESIKNSNKLITPFRMFYS